MAQADIDDPTLVATLRLSLVAGVGPRTRLALLERFGTAAAVFSATQSDVRAVPGVGVKLSRAIVRATADIDVAAEMEICRENNIRLLLDSDDDFPRVLWEIYDPPGVLYMRGDILPRDALAIASVGTRHATQYGLRQADRLGAGLARAGFTIVSGLARGIDAAAHRGAIRADGRTLAVLGGGLLRIYPPEHRKLVEQIARQGALISELPPRVPPASGTFPQRNRLVTGLCLGVVVVEAAERSGALISAEHAMEQGREVFAVPGPIDSHVSRGCHRLLREGARLVESVDDVLEELGPLIEATHISSDRVVRHPAELLLNEIEKAVLGEINVEPTGIG
jgi:DNA processing protein